MARNRKGSGRRMEGGCLVLFGLPFVLVGLGVMGLFGWQYRNYRRAAGWERVPAVIRRVEIKTHSDSDGTTYSVEAEYTYAYGGRTYTGTRVGVDLGSSSDRRHQERYERLREHKEKGKPFPAWVNPRKPRESLLFREMTTMSWVLLPFGLTFALAGAAVMAQGVAGARRSRGRARRLAGDPGRPWRADRRWAEGFVFDAREGRGLAAEWAGGLFLSLFLSMFVGVVFTHGAPFFAIAIVGVFVLVAVAVLVHAAYRTLRFLKYGSPRLALEQMPAVPGRALAALVLCRRHVDVEGAFKVTLKCERTTGSGDSQHIDKLHESAAEVAQDLAREWAGTAIPVEIAIPEGLPPTSAPGESPAVKWTLSVRAAAPGVDFAAKFDLPVFPVADENLIERRPAGEGT